MLVLARSKREGIVIRTPSGDLIKIVNLRVGGDSVSLGIEAPRDYRILRDELAQPNNSADDPRSRYGSR